MLKDLGVEDVKIQELFTVSIEDIEQLPYILACMSYDTGLYR